ncbi:membrin [Sphaerosporella brunnea]|uniref:Protein transport protein BOS1 n=1 Tax=Sphaerosporella brunnea TaxID=1250544 RepID=A0A5J5F024_9PEZI|nr:membrin [Sphaerosporella brunnea]
MNSLFNSALKQSQSLKRDLEAFSNSPATASPALQGQISASLAALARTIDDYESTARRELIPAKKEKAEARVKSFRKELAESRTHFEALKGERQEAAHTVARSELLGRRGHSSATPENPYANSNVAPRASSSPFAPAAGHGNGNVALAMEDHVFRERDFLSRTDSQLDEFLDRGRSVLSDLAEQRGMLKNTQKRLYSVANTLGISGDTIRMIERRAKQDKWFFYGGVVIFFGFCYLVLRWLR